MFYVFVFCHINTSTNTIAHWNVSQCSAQKINVALSYLSFISAAKYLHVDYPGYSVSMSSGGVTYTVLNWNF